jgi:hypothetical protein
MQPEDKEVTGVTGDGNEAVREAERQALPFDADSDDARGGQADDPDIVPAAGGYADRDPKTEMPIVPSAPETHDDPITHDAAPDPDSKEPGLHE